MWNRGGILIALILLIALGLALTKPPLSNEVDEQLPLTAEETQVKVETEPIYIFPVNQAPKSGFGWQESKNTKTWRYSSAISYNLAEGREIVAPENGIISALGEKVVIDHGLGYQSELWPIRAYYYQGTIEKGETIGVAYSQELNWRLTYFGEPIDPLTRLIEEP